MTSDRNREASREGLEGRNYRRQYCRGFAEVNAQMCPEVRCGSKPLGDLKPEGNTLGRKQVRVLG